MPEPIEHETERLRLIAWQERHIAPFAALNADPEVMRYFPAPLTEAETRAGVDIWRSQFEEKGWSIWAVELKASDEFIGFIGLSIPRRPLPFSPCVEVGWRLARRFWGNGYATEGAKASLKVGFERLGLSEIVSFTALANLPSKAVMERIGMSNTGRDFDHPAVPEGNPLRRHCLYSITREEWTHFHES
jgi:RimJ/RimL family protein N-acetyltransferase